MPAVDAESQLRRDVHHAVTVFRDPAGSLRLCVPENLDCAAMPFGWRAKTASERPVPLVT